MSLYVVAGAVVVDDAEAVVVLLESFSFKYL